ncbi:MAG TPA: type II secretion system protein GspM [Solirubrobacteraceae bacterium]|jgi:hypothetical protein
MTNRDRLVLMGVIALAILAGGWMLGVSPEREKAAKLQTEVAGAQQQLSKAQQQLNEAQGDQARYSAAYAAIVRLGKAVPADQEVPSLVYELDQVSNRRDVEFNSISTSASASSSSGAGAAAALTSAGFAQMPFTFVFNGSFVDLYRLLSQVQGFTVQTGAGAVQVSGRLLTIQGVNLELPSGGGAGEVASSSGGGGEGPNAKSAGGSSSRASSAKSNPENAQLKGTITATAYVLPPGQGLTGGASPAGPAGSAAAPASGPSASSPSTAPAAVIKVTP